MINAIRKTYTQPLSFELLRKSKKLNAKQRAEVVKIWVRSKMNPSAFENEHDLPAKSVKKLAMKYGLA